MEKSSIVYSFLVRAHNLQILRIEQGSTPRIDRSFCYTYLCCYREHKSVVPWAFLVLLPPLINSFRPLDLICIRVTSVRCHDVALPSISATVFMTPMPHGLTIVKLRVAYTRYPTGSTDRYSLAAIIKMEPFIRNRRYESSISIRARHYLCSCSSSS
jgi:hypothetical protein